MTSFDTLNVVLERAWRTVRGAAQVLEAGQQRRPLTERFDVLGGRLWDPTLRALVVGLTADGAAKVLSWISGKDHGPALISALKRHAFAEVQLDNGLPSTASPLGVSVGVPAGSEAANGFVAHDDPALWVRPGRLVLPCCEDVAGVRLLVPAIGSLSAPGSFSAVGPWLGLVIVAGEPDAEISESERAVIAELTSMADVGVAAVLGESESETESGWWEDRGLLRSRGALQPFLWSGTGPPMVPAFFRDAADPARCGITRGVLLRALQSGCDLLIEQLGERTGRLERRSSGAARRLRALDDSAREILRADSDRLRDCVGEHLAAIRGRLQESALEEFLPGSPRVRAPMDIVNAETNLPVVRGHDAGTITMRTSVEIMEKMAAAMSAGTLDSMRRELGVLRDGLGALQIELSGRLEDLLGRPVTLEAPNLGTDSDRPGTVDVKAFEFRPVTGLPERGFWRYLWEERQAVVTAVLVLSIAGLMTGLARSSGPLIGLAALGLAASLASGLVSWRQRELERREREIERLHAGLSAEVARIIEASQQARLEYLSGLMVGAAREFFRQIDAALLELSVKRDGRLSIEHERLRESIRADQERRRGLTALEDRIAQVRQVVQRSAGAHAADLQGAIDSGAPARPGNVYAGRY